jgi:hypothetical protein
VSKSSRRDPLLPGPGAERDLEQFKRDPSSRRDEIVSQAIREYDARLERRRRHSRWANRAFALLFGLALAWLVYSYFLVWQ